MTKRVRDGSITLDDYGAQSLEVAPQVETGLFMIRIDHLIYNDYMCNPLLNDLVIDLDDEPVIDSTARDSDQSNFPDCFTHAMVNVRGCEIPRNVVQADTIVVSCGLANFEQSSWSTHRRHESGERMKSSTRKRTTTSLFAVSRTTILGCVMVVQYGRSTAENSMIPTTTGARGNTLVEIQKS